MRKRLTQALSGGLATLLLGIQLGFGGWHAPAALAGGSASAPPQSNSNPGTGGSGSGGG
jgi:hypothetical protein